PGLGRQDQALRWSRPLRRRAARMARPARIRMRSRKPCVLARRRLFGWKVRLLTVVSGQSVVLDHVGRAGGAEAGSLAGAERLRGPHPQPADPLATARFAESKLEGPVRTAHSSPERPGHLPRVRIGTGQGQTEARRSPPRVAKNLRHAD